MRDYTVHELLRAGAEPADYVCGVPTLAQQQAAADASSEDAWSDDERGGEEAAEWPSENAPSLWTRLQVGETELHVCSDGWFRVDGQPFYAVHGGAALAGTPFRVVTVETAPGRRRTFFAHHLVWRAFQGEVPPGYEVRHKPGAARDGEALYDNQLEALDICPAIVSAVDF